MIPNRRSLLSFLVLLLLPLLSVGCKKGPDADPPTASTAHAHDGTDETCFICDPTKREPGRLWCKEHDRYEDRCWECHPDLKEADRPYCEEHGLYEDECFLCDPARAGAPESGDGSGAEEPPSDDRAELFCEEHQVPEHQCGVCQPQLAAELAPGDSVLVRLPSKRSAGLAGLTVGTPRLSEGSTSASLLGEIRYDGNRLARVTPLAAGVVAEVRVDVGQVVRKGELLAVVNAPAVAEAKARFVSSQHAEQLTSAALRRKEQLQEERIGSRRALEEATAVHASAVVAASLARQGLLNLGFSKAEVAKLGKSATSGLNLRAPFDGTVVERSAVLGAAVTGSEALFAIADLTQMWVELAVAEEVAGLVRVGTPVGIQVRALGSVRLDGAVSWVGPVVDERTRLVRARAVVLNPDGLLRQGMFADVTAVLEDLPDAVRLPASAVHRVHDLPFVFVRQEEDLFAARRVETGDRLPSDEFVIRAGIGLDDAVVMAGGYTLKSALLASRLGAGCTDD